MIFGFQFLVQCFQAAIRLPQHTFRGPCVFEEYVDEFRVPHWRIECDEVCMLAVEAYSSAINSTEVSNCDPTWCNRLNALESTLHHENEAEGLCRKRLYAYAPFFAVQFFQIVVVSMGIPNLNTDVHFFQCRVFSISKELYSIDDLSLVDCQLQKRKVKYFPPCLSIFKSN